MSGGHAGRLPEFPVAAFGSALLQQFCTAVAAAVQAPIEMVAMVMLGALSTVSLGARVDAGNGWREELALYNLIVMGAAERKSSVMSLVTRPLRELESEQREKEYEELAEMRLRVRRLESRRTALLKKYGAAEDDAAREEIWSDLKDVDAEINKFGDLSGYRLLADDITPEGLSGLLASHGRIGILSAEGSAIDNILGRYSEGKAKLDIVLKGFSGEPHLVDRTKNEPLMIDRPLLSITFAIQPPYLDTLVKNAQSRSLGLVSRFAFVIPRSVVGDRDPDAVGVDDFFLDGWKKTLTQIHTSLSIENNRVNRAKEGLRGKSGDSLKEGREHSLSLSLTPQARTRLRELQIAVEKRIGPGSDLAHMADWFGRHPGRVLRVAGLLHLAHLKNPDDPIDAPTIEDAIEIGEFLLAHARAALEGPGTTWQRALHVLERWPQDTISRSDLRRQVFNGDAAKEEAARLAEELVDAGLLEPLPVEKGKPGRPPSPAYTINRSNL